MYLGDTIAGYLHGQLCPSNTLSGGSSNPRIVLERSDTTRQPECLLSQVSTSTVFTSSLWRTLGCFYKHREHQRTEPDELHDESRHVSIFPLMA